MRHGGYVIFDELEAKALSRGWREPTSIHMMAEDLDKTNNAGVLPFDSADPLRQIVPRLLQP